MPPPTTRQPDYWDAACRQLASADTVMAGLIARYPGATLASHGDAFYTLARAIVGQQISVRAADAVWARLESHLGDVSPAASLGADADALRACGLSWRKVEYLQDLATHFADGRLGGRLFAAASDDELLARLTAVRGIGRWSAEMFLIFHLMRPDVLPVDDIGLLRAIGVHYGDGDKVSAREARRVAAPWAPWRTVAT
ncbi:MAG: DNA-3-methyladenine glycosylase 2 family protein, partial [Rhodocyclaceae bacterium]|nr:DNA-3-methyladenine glycosylase 2 family protein [Rhodocyclaceae bacterium]